MFVLFWTISVCFCLLAVFIGFAVVMETWYTCNAHYIRSHRMTKNESLSRALKLISADSPIQELSKNIIFIGGRAIIFEEGQLEKSGKVGQNPEILSLCKFESGLLCTRILVNIHLHLFLAIQLKFSLIGRN